MTIICAVRCPTCGEIIDPLYRKYKEKLDSGVDKKKIMTSKPFTNLEYCCKTVILTTQEKIDILLSYKQF